MSFAIFNTGSSSSILASVAQEPLWNAKQLNGTNIGDLSDIVDQAVLVWDATNNQWTWTTNFGGGGLEQIGTNLVGTADSTTVQNTAEENIIIGLNAGPNPAYTGYIGNTTLGHNTLTNRTTNYSVAIGYQAGYTGGATGSTSLVNNNFNSGRVLVGAYAGQHAGSNALDAIAIGYEAGQYTQGDWSIAIGRNAGKYGQQGVSVAIGYNAGFTGQNSNSVAIGQAAGQYGQSTQSVGIGIASAQTQQGMNCVAIGANAGSNYQYTGAVAIGSNAGYAYQHYNAVSVGFLAGHNEQRDNAIAIGAEAGYGYQGENSIAIGYRSGMDSLADNSICINATGSEFSPNDSGLFIRPVQNSSNNNSENGNVLVYYPETSEVAYNSNTSFDPESGNLYIQGEQVVGDRKNNYNVINGGSPTGSINFGTAGISELLNFVNQLYIDLASHGLLGTGD